MRSFIRTFGRSGSLLWILLVVVWSVSAQSSDLSFPTAITENQIAGQIKARDIGDSRLTTYYYTFNGTQGDLFINVVTKNLSGSIDVFTADAMRPLTKVLVYADLGTSETGRVVYLRKPEKLILRIEGRTPNDDPAEFRIKFAGGFEAAVPRTDEPPVPKVGELPPNESGVKVNSVGTIIAVIPKPTPSPKVEADETVKKDESVAKTEEVRPATVENKDSEQPKAESNVPARTRRPLRTTSRRNAGDRTATKAPAKDQPAAESKENEPGATRETVEETAKKPPRVVVTDPTLKLPSTPKPNPLENVRLVILFKDGTKVERPMTEVQRFTADQTTLTIINKNGRIAKFSILEVASVTIQ